MHLLTCIVHSLHLEHNHQGSFGKVDPKQCRNSQLLNSTDQGHWAIKGGDSQTGALKVNRLQVQPV
jgi:hypothetical protein